VHHPKKIFNFSGLCVNPESGSINGKNLMRPPSFSQGISIEPINKVTTKGKKSFRPNFSTSLTKGTRGDMAETDIKAKDGFKKGVELILEGLTKKIEHEED
jgi:hypothetical protein